MNVFGWLFRKRENTTLDDPIFGHIGFADSHDAGSWCHPPTGPGDPMIIIDAPQSGPTQAQRDFYLRLRDALASHVSEGLQFIARQDGAPSNLSGLSVYSIEIGSDEAIASGRFVIELSDEYAELIHRVEFNNGKPEVYGADD